MVLRSRRCIVLCKAYHTRWSSIVKTKSTEVSHWWSRSEHAGMFIIVCNRSDAGDARNVTDLMIGHCENKVKSCKTLLVYTDNVHDRSIAMRFCFFSSSCSRELVLYFLLWSYVIVMCRSLLGTSHTEWTIIVAKTPRAIMHCWDRSGHVSNRFYDERLIRFFGLVSDSL